MIPVAKSPLHSLSKHPKLGIIAGNGRFPFLVLDAARAQGYEVVVAAIKEETSPEIESRGATVHWLSLGELSQLIETFRRQGVTRAVMAGQVKHKQIFSSIRPDWRLAKLLLSLDLRNTDALLGAVAKVLADEGIVLENSTALLEPLLAKAGVLTKRAPSPQEINRGTPPTLLNARTGEFTPAGIVRCARAKSSSLRFIDGPPRLRLSLRLLLSHRRDRRA